MVTTKVKTVIKPCDVKPIEDELETMQELADKEQKRIEDEKKKIFIQTCKNNADSLIVDDSPFEIDSFANLSEVDIDWLWRDVLASGKITLLTGKSKIGKSLFTCYCAATVTNGNKWHDGTETTTGSVIMISLEDSPEETILPRLKYANADISKIYNLSQVKTQGVSLTGASAKTPFKLPRDFTLLEKAIRSKSVTLVIIDTVARCFTNYTHNEYVSSEVMTPLKELAERTGCAFLLINHFNKGKYNEHNLDTAIGGAPCIREQSRILLTALPDKTREKVVNIQHYGSNITEGHAMMSYKVVKDSNGRLFIQWLDDEASETVNPVYEQLKAKNASLNRVKIVQYLLLCDCPQTSQAIAQKLDIPYNTVRPELLRMESDGYIVKQSRGLYEIDPKYKA